ALSSDRKRRCSRLADVPGDQCKIIDDVYGFRALGAVVYTHRPADEGGFGLAVDQCGLVDLLGREPGELRNGIRRVLANRLFQLIETGGMRRNVFAIDETILDEQVNNAVEKSNVRSRLHMEIKVSQHRHTQNAESVSAVFLLNPAEFFRHCGERFVPPDAYKLPAFVAQKRVARAVRGLQRVVLGKTLRAKHASIYSVVRISAYAYGAAVLDTDEHPATDRAVTAGRGHPSVRNFLLGGVPHDRIAGVCILSFQNV